MRIDLSTLDRIAASDSPFRYVMDLESREWTVREVRLEGHNQPADAVLVFISESGVRQVQRFPVDWLRLDDTALFALTERSE